MNGRPKRNPVHRRYERDLEAGLDRMQASKAERVAARRTFAHHVSTGMRYRRAVELSLSVASGSRGSKAS